MEKFNESLDGPLHKQQFIKKSVQKFDNCIFSLKQFYCDNCKEMWPSDKDYCLQCRKDSLKFSKVFLLNKRKFNLNIFT